MDHSIGVNVKVLITQKYGTGWSTVNPDQYRRFLLTDHGLIDLCEREAPMEAAYQYALSALDEHAKYALVMIGWSSVGVVEVPSGTLFTVREYDGLETIIPFNADEWMLAL